MRTKQEIEKLLVDCGHAINVNNGQCALIEDVLCRVTSLCTELLKDADSRAGQIIAMLASDLGIDRAEVVRRAVGILNEARKVTRGHEADRNSH